MLEAAFLFRQQTYNKKSHSGDINIMHSTVQAVFRGAMLKNVDKNYY